MLPGGFVNAHHPALEVKLEIRHIILFLDARHYPVENAEKIGKRRLTSEKAEIQSHIPVYTFFGNSITQCVFIEPLSEHLSILSELEDGRFQHQPPEWDREFAVWPNMERSVGVAICNQPWCVGHSRTKMIVQAVPIYPCHDLLGYLNLGWPPFLI